MATDIPYGINMIVYGDSKVGKSWLGDTAPAPRLILDAEGGSRFTPSAKKAWNPATEQPPVVDGTWTSAFVDVQDLSTIDRTYAWLQSGHHPFRSVVLDSVSQIQQRLIESVSGNDQMTQPGWGEVLRKGSDLIHTFKNLNRHPTNPLDAVVFIAMEQVYGPQQKIRPYMQGALGNLLPYYVDLVAYLNELPTDDGGSVRRLYTSRVLGYTTGERIGGCLGRYVDNPNVADMVQIVRAYVRDNPNSTIQREAAPSITPAL